MLCQYCARPFVHLSFKETTTIVPSSFFSKKKYTKFCPNIFQQSLHQETNILVQQIRVVQTLCAQKETELVHVNAYQNILEILTVVVDHNAWQTVNAQVT